MHAYGEDANDCLKDEREEFMGSITKVGVFKLKGPVDVRQHDDPSLSFKRSGWLDYSQWCW